jgi:hypothetical protein
MPIQEQVYLDLIASIALTTVIFIDVLDFGSIDMTTYIDSWNTGTSPTKGNIAFDSNSNSSTVYSLFQLNSVTIAGYRKRYLP